MLVLAAFRDNGYNVVLVLHLLAAVVGVAPAVVAVVSPRRAAMDDVAVRTARSVYAPALIVAGLLGVVLILLSDAPGQQGRLWEFSQAWISSAFLVWIVMVGVYQALVVRGARAGGDAGRRQVTLGSQLLSVLVVVMLYLMVFKPGA